MSRTVELCTKPFVRVEHDAVCHFDTVPQATKFGADHGPSRPGRINMNVEPVLLGHRNETAHLVNRACARATDAGNDSGRQQARSAVGNDSSMQGIYAHGAGGTGSRNFYEIVLADARDPCRLVDRGMC